MYQNQGSLINFNVYIVWIVSCTVEWWATCHKATTSSLHIFALHVALYYVLPIILTAGILGTCSRSSWGIGEMARSNKSWTGHIKTLWLGVVRTRFDTPRHHSLSKWLLGHMTYVLGCQCMHWETTCRSVGLILAIYAQVHKKTGDVMLTAKAWNGRIICSWLSDILTIASRGVDDSYDSGRLTLVKVMMMLSWILTWDL